MTDFGIGQERVNPLTLMATSRGTVSFKAPEALQNPQGDSLTGDVWALGTSLYLLLTDQLPYGIKEENPGAMSEAFHHSPPPPSRWNALCDAELDRIVLKALHLDPQNWVLLPHRNSCQPWNRGTRSLPSRPSPRSGKRAPPRAVVPRPKEFSGSRRNKKSTQLLQLVLRSIAIAQDSERLPEAISLMEQALRESRFGEEYLG